MVHLKPRLELFKNLLVWFMMGEKLESQYYSLQGKRVLWQV